MDSPAIERIKTFSRRRPETKSSSDPKLRPFVCAHLPAWITQIAALTPPPNVFFSAFGTSRAAAGSFENQYKIEHDQHIEVIEAAHKMGSRVCVLLSSSSANASSHNAYARMKGEIENAVLAMGFETTIIIRPGVILDQREDSRPSEAMTRWFADAVSPFRPGFRHKIGQEAPVIARAAVRAALMTLAGEGQGVSEKKGKVWVMQGPDILKYGKPSDAE